MENDASNLDAGGKVPPFLRVTPMHRLDSVSAAEGPGAEMLEREVSAGLGVGAAEPVALKARFAFQARVCMCQAALVIVGRLLSMLWRLTLLDPYRPPHNRFAARSVRVRPVAHRRVVPQQEVARTMVIRGSAALPPVLAMVTTVTTATVKALLSA